MLSLYLGSDLSCVIRTGGDSIDLMEIMECRVVVKGEDGLNSYHAVNGALSVMVTKTFR